MSHLVKQQLDNGPTVRTTPPIRVYDLPFLLIYLANLGLMLSMSIMFRYADFVSISHGDEAQLGIIVGVGALGSLAARLLMGSSMDRYGTRIVWLCCLVLYAAGVLMHTRIETVSTPWVYVARVMMQCGFAGAMGASLTFVSLRVPAYRVAEIIGVLGSSGFLGMAIGPTIGDALFHEKEATREIVNQMFFWSAAGGGVSFVLTWLATRHHQHDRPTSSIHIFRALRKHHPGFILVVAAAMGLGLSLPGIFLSPFAKSKGIEDIHLYFWTYNFVAFAARLATARVSHKIGLRRMMYLGLGCLALSMPMYLFVAQQNVYSLLIPAIVAGLAHSFLFPAVIACGGASFPVPLRGTATALMLGMFDLGVIIGSPLVGSMIDVAPKLGWDAYPSTFLMVGLIFSVVTFLSIFLIPKSLTDTP